MRLVRSLALLALSIGSFAMLAFPSTDVAPAAAASGMPATSLQALIDDAAPGTTVLVPAGTYQGQVHIDEPLTLQGQGRPLLDGMGLGSVLHITAPDVTVSGFMIHGSGNGPIGTPSGIMVENADRTHIDDVTVMQSYIGITVRASADVLIEHCHIYGLPDAAIVGETHAVDTAPPNSMSDMPGMSSEDATQQSNIQIRGDGIWMWNTTTSMVRDTFIQNVRDGIYLTYGVHPILQDNRVLDSRYAVHDMNATDLEIQGNTFSGNLSGLVLMYGGPVNVRQNTIVESGSPSTGFGILVKDVGTTLVEENVIADNRVGLHLDNAGRTTGTGLLLTGNTIAMNQIGMMLYPSTVATFTRNSFVENSTQVTLGGQGTTQSVWDPGGVGNYWSDYGGYDANHDGVGDLPYTQSGRMSRLMEENPYLLALSSGPAFRLLSAVEDKWSPARALVTDNHPSMNSGAAQLTAGRSGNSVALWLPGAVLTLTCGIFLARARRPRRGKRNGVPAYA